MMTNLFFLLILLFSLFSLNTDRTGFNQKFFGISLFAFTFLDLTGIVLIPRTVLDINIFLIHFFINTFLLFLGLTAEEFAYFNLISFYLVFLDLYFLLLLYYVSVLPDHFSSFF